MHEHAFVERIKQVPGVCKTPSTLSLSCGQVKLLRSEVCFASEVSAEVRDKLHWSICSNFTFVQQKLHRKSKTCYRCSGSCFFMDQAWAAVMMAIL